MIDISWLLASKKSFVDFAKTLHDLNVKNLYESESIKALTKEFWQENFNKIVGQAFFPSALYMLLSMFFLMYTLQQNFWEDAEGWESIIAVTNVIVMIILILIQLYQEF